MGRSALVWTVATLGVAALIGLFAALSILFSSPTPVYAQSPANSAPEFTEGTTATRSVAENTPAYTNIGNPVAATDSDTDDRLTYSIDNAHTKNFTIHQRTGQLQVGGPLDYETKNSYTVTVKATDPSGDSDTIEVTINVTNVEESGTVTLSWTKPQVSTAITATLTDPDGSISGESWQWEKSTNRSSWSNATGTGATSATYTPVANDGYLRATASYTDGEGSTKTAHARTATTVRETPANNNPPEFYEGQPGQYDCGDSNLTTFCTSIRTSHPVGKSIYYPVKATDDDRGDEIRYSLEGNGSEHFRIESIRGTLFTKTLPRDLPANSYTLTIRASDQSDASNAITVKITRLGSYRDPVIVGPSRITYPENGTWPVARYSVSNGNTDTDPYKGRIGLNISVEPRSQGESRDGDFFRINDEGVLLFEQPPDYEGPRDEDGNNTYSFGLTAYETNPPSGRYAQTFFSVTVTVVNVDETLEILGPSVVDYPENSTDAVHTYTVSGADGPVTWSPPSGTDGDNFSISQTGELAFISPPDYENPLDLDGGGRDKDQPDNGYLVAITVEDGTNIKTEHVKVRVTNVNENPTFDDDLETTITVDPNIGASQQVGDPYTASDPDESANLTYSLSTNTLPFEIDPYNGQLSTISTLTQFDRTSYTVTVLVTDNADDEDNYDTTADDQITVTINIGEGGSSNNAPVFPSTPLTFNVDENTSTVVDVGNPVTANDGDSDTLAYTLEGTDAGFFTIVGTSGQIQTKASQNYDYETKPTYSVTVKADDSNGGTATKAVTITLTNVEEPGTVTLSPTQPAARQAVTATLTDPDEISGTPTWEWERSTDGSTGWSTVGTNSDTYTPGDGDLTYFLRTTASYTDGHGGNKSAQAVSSSAVQAGTNRAPTFTDGLTTSRNVVENTAASGNVGAPVAATDDDGDTPLAYSLTGADESSFTVDSNGQIKVGTGTTLDYEAAKNDYTVIVQVHDGKNPSGGADTAIDDTIVVTINVTNVNEKPTFNDGATTTRDVPENTAANTNIGNPVGATDPDTGDTLTYSLGGTDATSFAIDTSTGQLKTKAALDKETKANYAVTVSVRDSKNDAGTVDSVTDATITVNITVTEENDPPEFSGTTATREIAENPTAVTNVGDSFTASDDDAGDTLTYSLEGTDAASFDIDETNGQIKTKSAVTYNHEDKDSYSVTVKVVDNKGGTDTIDVTITLTNVEEAGTVRLSPTQPAARQAVTAILTDPDKGITDTSWQWAKSTTENGSYTNITDATSDSYTPPDADLNNYLQATATYTDGEGSDKTATAKTVGPVQAGTNRPPTFTDGQTVTREVPENTAASGNVGAVVAATDADNDSLTYSLTSTDASSFTVDNTGQIRVGATTTLDYESAKNTYTVVVRVTDSKNPAGDTETNPTIDDYITVTINVTDVEETGTVSFSTTQPAVRAQITATLTDPDGGVTGTTWAWASSSTAQGSYTAISGATSATYTPVDRDVSKFLKATASYEDRRGTGKTASAVTDNAVVTGTNQAPEFPAATTTREFAENTAAGQNIGIPVAATDEDNNDVLEYTLEGTDKDSFQIVETSGQIQTKPDETYDHEDTDSYSVTVKVVDGNGGSDTIDVTITVIDVNEKPTFPSTETGSREIAEHSAINTNIGSPVDASDPDDGDTLTYRIDGTHADLFSIDPSSGQVRVKDPEKVDFETQPLGGYLFNVYIRDGRGPDGSPDTHDDSNLPFTITVTDINEPPQFPASENGVRSVPENTAVGQKIGNPVSAVDPDTNASLTYTLGGTDVASFDFDTLTGQLKTKAGVTYNHETKPTYSVTVSVRDSKDDAGIADTTADDTITVTISVTNANESPVLSGSAAVDYAENGTGPVHTYSAFDPEGARIEWSLKGTDDEDFDIEGGVLTFKESPNYEDPSDYDTDKAYSVTVVATDGHNPVERTVTITLTDENDTPSFSSETVNRVVAESRQPGETVGTPVSATDEDTGDTLTYSLGGEDSTSFGIDSSTGLIKVGTGTTLDFETRPSYQVTVTVTDSSYTSDTIVVTIEVSNVDETGEVTLSQARPQEDTPLTAEVSDEDGIDLSTLSWKWEISTDKNSWDAIANATSADYTPVSGDVGKYLRVTASYTDEHGPNKTAQAAPADTVRAVPLTNAAPDFPSSETGARSIAENTAAGENVGAAVAATDANSGDTLTYTLGGVDAPYFSIVSSSGQIQTKAPLDYEAKSSYTVTVTATDPSRETDTITVTITVTDANEPPLAPSIPAMTLNSQTSLTMAWTAPSNAGRPAITDYDYRYKKNAENTWTEVTNTAITVTSVEITGLDATTYYDVQVRAINAEGTGNWSASGIGITRTRPNNSPAFPSSTTTRQVAENTEARENVGNPVDAQDTDNDRLTYILEGFDASSFMIDSDTGQLKTRMPLDHETDDSYSVMVKAVDGQGGSDSIGVIINVVDVNEPPEFSGNLGVHSVAEDAGPGMDIGAPVAATDPENDTLVYSLDSAGAQVFAINPSTGQLQTKVALDYETARVHSVTVYVSDRKDAAGNADTATDDEISVTITVTNVNEPPAFTGPTLGRSVDENSQIGTAVGDPITATDPEGDTLVYSLSGTDAASFSIDTSSGQLKTATALDFESAKKSYTVTVSVSDSKNADGNNDPAIDATVTVTIAVADVNESPMVTIRSTVRYAENGTDPVDTYTVTDPENGTITWDLSGADVDDFEISKVNGDGVLEFKTPPNFEAPADDDSNNVYLVTVEVSDGTNTDRLNVAVTVFNVNEEPYFPAETGARNVDENTAANQDLGDAVAATDPEGHTLTYKLAGTDAGSFAIDTATGQLKTKAPLDYETKPTYLVTVHVRDSLDQDDRVNAVTDDTINMTITINNVEEPGWIVFSSRQPQIDTPFTATIEDPDGGVTSTTWAWENSSNGSTGWTTATGTGAATNSYTPVAADSGKYLRVTASYEDGEAAGKSAVGVSDNPVREEPATNVAPTFGSSTTTRSVDEGTAAGQPIGAPVAATDGDAGDANLLTYSMTGADAASFNINRATGQLLTKAPLDHEDEDSYSVTVKVVDPSLESATITVNITINDVDEPPVLAGPDVVDYPENGVDAVAEYTATDPEGVTITDWSLDGDDKDLFEINNAGELTFKASPDHDIAGDSDGDNIYLVTVKASDGTNTVTLNVAITVSNVNEAPEFPSSEDGARTVAENTAADQNIGDPVTATDPDSGDILTYALGGTDAGSFTIDETTGQLKTKVGVTYDHEAKGAYEVTVTATDQSGLYAIQTVTVTVLSVNEVPEFTDGATTSRSIDENTPAGQDIGAAVAATDPEDDTLTYTLGGEDAPSFAIEGTTGQLKTLDQLDYESRSSYSVTVAVSDGKDIDGNADTSVDNTIEVTIDVTDQGEDGTVILSSLQPQVDAALTATLVDPDDATNVNWTWARSSSWSSGWTAISNATSDSYTPVAGDVGNYLRATATFTNSGGAQVSAHGISAYPVRAAPANNAAPAFATATATRSIAEDAPVGSAVGDPVTATDTDTNDVLTYTLSGTDAASFTIGMASGQLWTKVTLDHDTTPSYTVVVTAADPSGLSDTITVTITVTDENEPPVISGKTTVYYVEDRTDAVATYTATDPEDAQITWSLAGEDSGDFSISATGVLTFSTQPDRENPADEDANNVYLVTVQASDGPNTVPLDVVVTVTDEADPPPAPDAPTVEPAATDGHTALSVSWQAPTSSASPITGYAVEYRKQGVVSWSSENVTITGVTSAITNVLPDTAYEVQVRAENADGWGAWSEPGTGRTEVTPLDQQIDLTVSYQAAGYTVNEGATGNVSVTLSAAADRAMQVPITVAPLTAESGDYQVAGLTSGALAFVPGDSTKSFTFQGFQDTDTDDETVTLGFGQSLPDKVTLGDRTTSVVTIDDDDPVSTTRRRRSGGSSGGGGSSFGSFGSPSSANKAPVFTDGDSTTRSVAENTAAGTAIGKAVTATDADNDTLNYTVGGDDGSAFAVDSATGQLKTKSALDFERRSSYTVTMGVFDDNGGSDTITVTITVTDVTDVPLASGSTQMMGVVDSEADTTVSTLNNSVAVTFPSGSRSGDYQVRLDYGTTNCDLSVSGEQLWFCLAVDIFDNEGNLEQGVVLSQAATIKITRNADERGGVDAVLALHEQGGVNVYTRGRTGGEWSEQDFTLESDGAGGIVITITGVSSFGLYAGTTDQSVPVQVSQQSTTTTSSNTDGQGSSPEPTPTPTPQPTPADQQSPTPDPTATPEPTVAPGQNTVPDLTSGHQVSSPFAPLGGPEATPTPVPTPPGIAKALGNLPLSLPQSGNLVPTAEPEVKEASFDLDGGKSPGMPSWYIALIMLGVAASMAGGGTYYMKRRRRLPNPIMVRRSREFNRWW